MQHDADVAEGSERPVERRRETSSAARKAFLTWGSR